MIDKHIRFTNLNGEIIVKHIRAKDEQDLNSKIDKIQKELLSLPLLSKVIEQWQEFHDEEINYNTRQCYIAPIKNIKEYFKEKHIDEITPLDIDVFIKKLYTDYHWSRQTIKLRLIVLNQVYNFAIVKGYVKYNPCSAVKVPVKAKSNKRGLPQQNSIEIIKKSVADDFGLFPYLLIYTGCRRGEALALSYRDINWEEKTITINKTVIYKNGKPEIQDHTKSNAGNRIVPLLPPLEKVLNKRGRGYIFTFEGKLLTQSKFIMLWDIYKKEHNISLTPHQLRHAYATILYEAGVQIKDAQALLGHASSEITQEIYTHISEKQQNKTFAQLINYVDQTT